MDLIIGFEGKSCSDTKFAVTVVVVQRSQRIDFTELPTWLVGVGKSGKFRGATAGPECSPDYLDWPDDLRRIHRGVPLPSIRFLGYRLALPVTVTWRSPLAPPLGKAARPTTKRFFFGQNQV